MDAPAIPTSQGPSFPVREVFVKAIASQAIVIVAGQ
jgi:hypothetical protein